ncbi:MAG TPA: glycosyltransferase family 39 protein [Terriglobia bacterium]|nr:glycosyltransferase family 39 protein [Terriglobia bacterium]
MGCLVTLVTAARAVPLPYELDFDEGPVLGVGVRIAHGLSAYPPATEFPYVTNPFGPLPYYLAGLCVKLFGVSFTAPRILTVVLGIWCAAVIALLVRHWGGAAHVSLGFGLLYLSRPLVTTWLPQFRADWIGLAFTLTGLYLFARSCRWYLAVPFFVTALFCKITFLAAPLACFLYLLFRREGVKATRFAACNLALGGLAFLGAQRATHGWFAFGAFWVNAARPYDLRPAISLLHNQLAADYLLVVLALALAYDLRSRPELSLPLIYLGTAFLMTLGVVKSASASYYFLEWQAVLCGCAGVGYSYLRTHSDLRSFVSTLMPAVLAAMVVLNLHRPTPDPMNVLSECGQAYEYVKDYPGGLILSENPGAVVMAGKSLAVFDPWIWTRMVVDEGWPDTEIVDLLRSHKIDLVVLGRDLEELRNRTDQGIWPNSVAHAIEENYRPVRTFNCEDANFVFRPETPPH